MSESEEQYRLREVTKAAKKLSAAVNSFWIAPKGLALTGMGEIFVKEIKAAQNELEIALQEVPF